jgi:hypothetical protein
MPSLSWVDTRTFPSLGMPDPEPRGLKYVLLFTNYKPDLDSMEVCVPSHKADSEIHVAIGVIA